MDKLNDILDTDSVISDSTYYSSYSSSNSSTDLSTISIIESTDDSDSCDSDSDSDSCDSVEEYIEITEDELFEITQTIYQLMEEYITVNILSLSSGKFYQNMIKYVVELIFTDICEMCMIKHDDYDNDLLDELTEFIEQVSEIFLDIYHYQHNIPRRSLLQNNNDIVKPTCGQVNKIHDKIKILQNIIQPEQRTKEWYEFRYQLITASNLWKVFGTESQVNSLIYEKCKIIN